MRTEIVNLLLLLLPLTGFSQYDKYIEADSIDTKTEGNKTHAWKRSEPKLYTLDTLPYITTSQSFNYYNGTSWGNYWSTEEARGKVETPINVMDTGIKVETVETRDTIYTCPYSGITYFTLDGNMTSGKAPRSKDCKLDKIITTRRYKLYIINEYGQKEYLNMELTKQK